MTQLHNPKVSSSTVLPTGGVLNKDIQSVSALVLMNPANSNESGILMPDTNPPTPANKKKLLARSTEDDSKLEVKILSKRGKLSRTVRYSDTRVWRPAV